MIKEVHDVALWLEDLEFDLATIISFLKAIEHLDPNKYKQLQGDKLIEKAYKNFVFLVEIYALDEVAFYARKTGNEKILRQAIDKFMNRFAQVDIKRHAHEVVEETEETLKKVTEELRKIIG